MTREEVIRLAKEAGLSEWHESIQDYGFKFAMPERLERFAELVAAEEREACALVAERLGDYMSVGKHVAGAIRARGDSK